MSIYVCMCCRCRLLAEEVALQLLCLDLPFHTLSMLQSATYFWFGAWALEEQFANIESARRRSEMKRSGAILQKQHQGRDGEASDNLTLL